MEAIRSTRGWLVDQARSNGTIHILLSFVAQLLFCMISLGRKLLKQWKMFPRRIQKKKYSHLLQISPGFCSNNAFSSLLVNVFLVFQNNGLFISRQAALHDYKITTKLFSDLIYSLEILNPAEVNKVVYVFFIGNCFSFEG